MSNKEKKAIESLNRLITKLDSSEDFSLLPKLCDMVALYIGKESILYENSYSWIGVFDIKNKDHKKPIEELITNVIEYIQDNGVKREIRFWRWVESINQSLLWSIITGITLTIGYAGFLIGRYTSLNNQYNDVLNQIINNKSRLEMPNQIPKIETNSDTSNYKDK